MECNQNDLFESIPACDGEINLPGIAPRLYFMPFSQIVAWPPIERPDGSTSADKIAAYQGNFTLAADAKWRYLDIVQEKSPLTFESQGEEGSKSIINKGEIKVQGTKAAILAFCAMANNTRMVYLAQRADGKFCVLGCRFYRGAKTTPSGALGASPTDEHATTLAIEATDFVPLPLYPGEIETEDGKISGATGEPLPDEEA